MNAITTHKSAINKACCKHCKLRVGDKCKRNGCHIRMKYLCRYYIHNRFYISGIWNNLKELFQ